MGHPPILEVSRNSHYTASVPSSRGSTYAPFCYLRSCPDHHRGYRFPSRASRFWERLLLCLRPIAGRVDLKSMVNRSTVTTVQAASVRRVADWVTTPQ